ncbi:MAG: haloacid dehalogenase [Desulfobulbaceae bacterium]|nr:MAG: haloacid dehalogenase [Desulfobulbaceae bacterium]
MRNKKREAVIDWRDIDTVLLDMDGTLLDKHFDDYFWEQYVPEVYASQNNISIFTAEEELLAKYKEQEGGLAWTDLDFWSEQLDLDIERLKKEVDHLIAIHPYVLEFLEFCRNHGKRIYLVTNAHPKTLAIKMAKTKLAREFDELICADEIGLAKEEPLFWEKLQGRIAYDKKRTLLADDNERVLASAAAYGIGHLIFVAKSSSRLPTLYSANFPSIIFFKELMEPSHSGAPKKGL